MTKNKNLKRALITSVLALVLCCTMLIGTTYAWFTDSVSSAGNVIKSGTLNVDLLAKGGDLDTDALDAAGVTKDSNGYYSFKSANEKGASTAIFNYDKWEPGYTEWVNAKVSTTGNLALKYTLKIVATGEVSALADVIDVYYAPQEVALPSDRGFEGLARIGTLRDAVNGIVVINDTLIPEPGIGEIANTEDYATLALHMQESAGNEYQDLAIGTDFSLQILASQYTYEEDSFDDQYDADATAPIYVRNQQELTAALQSVQNAGLIIVEKDISGTAVAQYGDKQFTLDLGGHTLQNGLKVWQGNVTVKNGTIREDSGSQCVRLDPDPGHQVTVTIAEDVLIDGSAYGVTLWPEYGSDTADSVLNMYGTVKGNIFVSGNLQKGNSVINVYGSVEKTTENSTGVSINGYAAVNVYSGASVKGATGVEVRAGKLYVEDGATIEGWATPTSVRPNGSGTTTSGAGVAVAQHTTKLAIDVQITGGVIKGHTPLYESNPQANGDEDLDKITINVTGGTFEITNGGTNRFFVEDEGKIHYTNTVA